MTRIVIIVAIAFILYVTFKLIAYIVSARLQSQYDASIVRMRELENARYQIMLEMVRNVRQTHESDPLEVERLEADADSGRGQTEDHPSQG